MKSSFISTAITHYCHHALQTKLINPAADSSGTGLWIISKKRGGGDREKRNTAAVVQDFPAVATRMQNLAMRFEREPHLGAGRYERTEERTGYANGHKPKTLKTAAVRQFLRTSNMEANLNRQIKQRTKLTPAFPNVDSLRRLVSAICVEISDEWETNGYRYMSAIKEL